MTKIIRTSAFTNGFSNKDRFLISLFLLFSVGILIGSVAAGSNATDKSSLLFQINSSHAQSKAEKSFFELFWNTFLSEFFYLLICYVSGLCAIGIPILFIIPLIYGIGKGLILGFIYAKGGFLGILNGFLFHSIQGTGGSILMIIALKTSYKMSRQTFKNLSSTPNEEKLLTFKKYNKFYIIILIINALFCTLDALMFKVNIFI